MIAKPDRFAVRLGERFTLRVTDEGQILLAKDLSIEELRETVTELAQGLVVLHGVTLTALEEAFAGSVPNGACPCPNCNLMRLRDSLSAPTLQ